MTEIFVDRPIDGTESESPGLFDLLRTREYTQSIAITSAIGLAAGAVAWLGLGWELWRAVAVVIVTNAVPVWWKWRADARRFGLGVAVAGAMVTIQGLHTIEHLVQWAQLHVFGMSFRDANGLLSAANTEWVHFVWNWAVMAAVVYLMTKGMRGFWGWALFAWAFAHTMEHTYLFAQFLAVRSELHAMGLDTVTAQGLPGIIGEGGWLDLQACASVEAICGLPGFTTANRIDTHFWWNAGEMMLLLAAVRGYLSGRISTIAR